MKHEIKLTATDSGTIHVDDVRVEEGVYAKCVDGKPAAIVSSYDKKYVLKYINFEYNGTTSPSSLSTLIQDCAAMTFHTLSGLRIVTEKVLTVADLKMWDSVGFTKQGYKYQVAWLVDSIVGICAHDNGRTAEAVSFDFIYSWSIDKLYRFDTSQELHQWLAE